MISNKKILALLSSLLLPILVFAHDHSKKTYGTKEEAKELLLRATNLLKADEIVGLTMMTVQTGGFIVKDLYPLRVCSGGMRNRTCDHQCKLN